MAALLGIVANAMFLDAYGSAWLPATYIAIGAAGIVVSGAIARTAQRFDLLGISLAVLGAAAVGLTVAWLVAAGGDSAWVSVPLLVLFPILIQLGFVFIGGQAGRLLDIAGIKASFPRIMAGFPVGAVFGGLLGAELVSRLGRTEDLLLATAIAQAAFAGLVWATGRRYGGALRLPDPLPQSDDRGPMDDDRTGRPSLRRLFASRFVLLVLAYQVLSALGSQLADFLVFDRAAAAYPDAADLARFLAGYTAVMNVASIGFLVVLAGPLLRRFGLGLGIAANPVVLTLFAGAMVAVNAVTGGTSLALLWVVSAARIGDIALTDGTTRTSINAIYQVIPERARLPVQTAVEGIGVPVAIGISGVLILALNALSFALTATIVVTALVCVVWTWVGILLYRAYGPALVHALQRRPLLVPIADLNASAEDEVAARDLLSSPDARATRLGLDMLTAMSSPAVSVELDELTRDPRPEIRLSALAALSGSGDESASRRLADEVAGLLDDEDLAVRCAALDSVHSTHAFAVRPAIAALREPRSAGAAAGAVGRLGDAILPALADLLESAGQSAPSVTMRLVRAATTRSSARDEILRGHVVHPDRELALAVTERLIAPEPADGATAIALDAVLIDDARHAARILAAVAALDAAAAAAGAANPPKADEPLRRALGDEHDLVGRKVKADVLARHGSARLGPVMVELVAGEPAGAGRSSGALALEALGVLIGTETSRLVLALLQPDLSISERLGRLPTGLAGDGLTDLTGWQRDLVEDPDGQWRSTWLRACAIHAARARGLLEGLDLGPARALHDPIIDEVLVGL
jgi:HEAT repeat protein